MKLLICLLVCLSTANAANILAIYPTASPSHYILGTELMKALLKKGHHVTMVAPYKMSERLGNYTEIVLEEMAEYKKKHLQQFMTLNASKIKTVVTVLSQDYTPRLTLENPEMKALLKSNKQFDVVVLDAMLCESLLAIGHFFNAPTVVASSFGSNSGAVLADEVTFVGRLIHAVLPLAMEIMFLFVQYQQHNVLHEYFPNAPPLKDLMNNISITLLNAHYSVLEPPRPYLPNVIPIGGFHIQSQTLPMEIKDFLDGAKDGAVLFSLGSNARSADMSQEQLNTILKTFSKLPQKFLWKFEDESIDVPRNVKVMKWLPQRAVLDHPNIKAFISHGGLLSVTEAVYYGIPFIGVPAFGDQSFNVAFAVRKKFAIQYDLNTITEETFTEALREILQNPIYKANIAIRSSLLREQPIPPLDLAVYWIEHVIKHKGAPHLQNVGIKLSWWQRYLLDVFAFLAAVCIVITYVNYLIFKKIFGFICNRLYRKQKLKSS